MKTPISQHLAVILAETGHDWSLLKWVNVVLIPLTAVLAVVLNIWWLWLITACAAVDALVLYLGNGIYGLLESDRDDVSVLRRRYRSKAIGDGVA